MSTVSKSSVSILLPVKNGRAFVGEAIRSIEAQEWSGLQIVVVDDDSSDGTSDLLKAWAERNPAVVLLRTTGEGIDRALNVGALACDGEYIARVDIDDPSGPTRITRQVATLDAMPTAPLAAADYEVEVEGTSYRKTVRLPVTREAQRLALTFGNPIAHSAVLMRKEALNAVGGYRRVAPAEDYDLWVRMLALGEFAVTDEPLVRVRIRAHSVSRVNRVQQSYFADRVRAEMQARDPLVDYSPTMHREFRRVAEGLRGCKDRCQAHRERVLRWLYHCHGLEANRMLAGFLKADPGLVAASHVAFVRQLLWRRSVRAGLTVAKPTGSIAEVPPTFRQPS